MNPITINGRVFESPKIDYAAGASRLWCLPGKAIFAAMPPQEANTRDSGLLIADGFTRRQRLPVATCIQAHPSTGLKTGDVAIVDQRYAKRVRNVKIADWTIGRDDAELWLFGCSSPWKGESYGIRDAWACAYLDSIGEFPDQPEKCSFETLEVENGLRAVDRIRHSSQKLKSWGSACLTLPKPKYEINGIAIPDRLREWPDMAIVRSVSPECEHLKPGHVAWYQRAGLHGWGSLPEEDFASIHEHSVFALVDVR